MLFGQMLVKVSDREVRVKFALEPAQLADRLRCCALAPRPPTPLIHHCRYPLALDRAADPPHLSWRHCQNISRRHPTELSVDCLGDYFTPGHCLDLPRYLPFDASHRAAVACQADIFKCL
jgi:hypothetical protein